MESIVFVGRLEEEKRETNARPSKRYNNGRRKTPGASSLRGPGGNTNNIKSKIIKSKIIKVMSGSLRNSIFDVDGEAIYSKSAGSSRCTGCRRARSSDGE